MVRILLLFALAFPAHAVSAASAESPFAVRETHRGLTLGGIALRPNAAFDIDIVAPRQALAHLKRALDILYERSPFSARAIETLRRAGEVVVVYDPHFPKSQLSGLTIAAFFPDFYQRHGPAKQFVTVVGRYGAKWPVEELAAVLAHELVGHGMQHYRGRLEHVRTIDLECEAYLYEERVYQDLALDKRSGEMIKFRQALEDHWCKSFRAHLQRHDRGKLALWERLNPDVPGILEAYLKYIEDLRRTGAAQKAIDIERRDRLRR